MSKYLDYTGLSYFWQKAKEKINNFLPLSGGTMSGPINMGGSKIQSVASGTSDTDAANFGQVKTVTPKVVTLSLPISGWSSNTQTVTASGVSADETAQIIYIVPATSVQADYVSAGVSCTAQGANSLTFTCKKTPTQDLTVYATIQELRA